VTPVTAALMHRMAKYFITSTPKCFALAVAAVSAELTAILPNKIHTFFTISALFGNSARAQNHRKSDIPT